MQWKFIEWTTKNQICKKYKKNNNNAIIISILFFKQLLNRFAKLNLYIYHTRRRKIYFCANIAYFSLGSVTTYFVFCMAFVFAYKTLAESRFSFWHMSKWILVKTETTTTKMNNNKQNAKEKNFKTQKQL